MSDMEDISMQQVGMRDDNEKETYEPYTSRERYCEQLYQRVPRISRSGVYAQQKSPSLPNYNGVGTKGHRQFQGHTQRC